MGARLILWVDHHEHQRHLDFAADPRFVLSNRREHPATPEMITPQLVERAGPIDTIVTHVDLDCIYAAAKFLLGGLELTPDIVQSDPIAQDIFQGYKKLSAVGRAQLKNFVRFLEYQEETGEF